MDRPALKTPASLPFLALALLWPQEPEVQTLVAGERAHGELVDSSQEVHTPTLDAMAQGVPAVGAEYELRVETSGTWHVELCSSAFDAYLVLRDSEGELVAEDDDGGVSLNSRVVTELEAGHGYRIVVCALRGGRGDFELSLSKGRPAASSATERRIAEDADTARRLAWIREHEDEETPGLAAALSSTSQLLWQQGKQDEAQRLCERALRIREASMGAGHPAVAESLNNLGTVCEARGDYARAEELYLRSAAIWEETLGPDDREVGNTLNNLASIYLRQGRPADAQAVCERALRIMEECKGPRHPDTALVLFRLASVSSMQGRYVEAEPRVRRALAIWEEALGREHGYVAACRTSLAEICRHRGRYADAELQTRLALAAYEASLGPDHPFVASCLLRLGMLCSGQGRYTEAEPLYERALGIEEARLGGRHPEVATCLQGLARLYRLEGRHDDAEPLLLRALAIREEALGAEHPDVSITLHQLAGLYLEQRRLAEVEPLLLRAWDIAAAHPTRQRFDLAQSQGALAYLRELEGRLEDAEELYRRAIETKEGALGPDHPDLAASLNSLAHLLAKRGRHAEAESSFERALSISAAAFGPTHPRAIRFEIDLADLHRREGRHAEAERGFEHALRATLEHLDRELPTMPEPDRFRLLGEVEGPGRMLAEARRVEGGASPALFELCSEWKGKVTRLQSAGIALSRSEPGVRARIDRLQELQRALSELVLLPSDERPDDRAARVASLRDERLGIERELNRELGLGEALATPSYAQVQAALPDDAALVDFHVGSEVFAWVLRPDGDPELLTLGDADSVQVRERERELLASLVTRGVGVAAPQLPDERAYRTLWGPLAAAVGDARTVFVCPDGFLCELPLGVLRDEEGRFLLEKHRFVYLSDPSRIVSPRKKEAGGVGSLLLVGDVDYGDPGEVEDGRSTAAPLRSPVRGLHPRLPGTAAEIEALAELHARSAPAPGALLRLTGREASEERLRAAIAGRRCVHLATHGYFEPEVPRERSREATPIDLLEEHRAVELLPGLLSGLVLAGADAEPDPEREDGYLSAEEIQYLDLSACELAVLSACETALGSERAGNGLMSLRRAFEVAGARSVVSSLWRVDDRATVELMEGFYENLWVKSMGRAEALHRAKLRMLARNRAEHDGDALPATWGAFVLSGDWD